MFKRNGIVDSAVEKFAILPFDNEIDDQESLVDRSSSSNSNGCNGDGDGDGDRSSESSGGAFSFTPPPAPPTAPPFTAIRHSFNRLPKAQSGAQPLPPAPHRTTIVSTGELLNMRPSVDLHQSMTIADRYNNNITVSNPDTDSTIIDLTKIPITITTTTATITPAAGGGDNSTSNDFERILNRMIMRKKSKIENNNNYHLTTDAAMMKTGDINCLNNNNSINIDNNNNDENENKNNTTVATSVKSAKKSKNISNNLNPIGPNEFIERYRARNLSQLPLVSGDSVSSSAKTSASSLRIASDNLDYVDDDDDDDDGVHISNIKKQPQQKKKKIYRGKKVIAINDDDDKPMEKGVNVQDIDAKMCAESSSTIEEEEEEEDEEDEKEVAKKGKVGEEGKGKTIDDHDSPMPERGQWSGNLDFIFSCISYAVGLGNVWRFPYLCYENGGGAFLVPYLICVFVLGVPLFILEVSLGQYLQSGGVAVWNQIPLFKGIGMASMVMIGLCNTYYIVIISWTLYYLFNSFRSPLPWSRCDQWWNSPACHVHDVAHNSSTGSVPPSQEFWNLNVLGITSDMAEIGHVQWHLFITLIIAWLLVYFVIYRGIHQSGKIIWFSAMFPYVILILLFGYGISLSGAKEGILFYITPKWYMLKEAKIWVAAGTQLLFTYGIGIGTNVALGSYNTFHHNFFRDSLIACLLSSGTSLFSGFVIFSVLGHLAESLNTTVAEVARSGPGLTFIVYPEAVTRLPVSNVWAVLFFVMLLVLGIDSQFCTVESFVTGVVDEFPRFLRPRRKLFTATVVFVHFLLGISMITQGGMYVFQLMDYFSASGISLMIVVLMEIIGFCWIYGGENVYRNSCKMLGFKIPRVLYYIWKYVSPTVLLGILIFSIVKYEAPEYAGKRFPWYGEIFGWIISCASIVCIPLYMLYYLFVKADKNLSIYERLVSGLSENDTSERKKKRSAGQAAAAGKKMIIATVDGKNGAIASIVVRRSPSTESSRDDDDDDDDDDCYSSVSSVSSPSSGCSADLEKASSIALFTDRPESAVKPHHRNHHSHHRNHKCHQHHQHHHHHTNPSLTLSDEANLVVNCGASTTAPLSPPQPQSLSADCGAKMKDIIANKANDRNGSMLMMMSASDSTLSTSIADQSFCASTQNIVVSD